MRRLVTLALTTLSLMALVGCGTQAAGGVNISNLENVATARVTGNAVPGQPYLATGVSLRPFLPASARLLVAAGATFIEPVTLANLPSYDYLFLETAQAHVISRLPFYPTAAQITATALDVYIPSSAARAAVASLFSDSGYLALVQSVCGLNAALTPVQSLPKSLRSDVSPAIQTWVVSFLVIPSTTQGAVNFRHLFAVRVVLSPTSGMPVGSYSSALPFPPGF
ncbi:MAG: hypothetical protein ACYCO4_07065 [Sulfobacillus sp.]